MKINLDFQNCFITPVNLLKITRKVFEMSEDDELEIITNDHLTVHYLKKIIKLSNIGIETKIEERDCNFHILITKNRR